jgi:hypothetical protein
VGSDDDGEVLNLADAAASAARQTLACGARQL